MQWHRLELTKAAQTTAISFWWLSSWNVWQVLRSSLSFVRHVWTINTWNMSTYIQSTLCLAACLSSLSFSLYLTRWLRPRPPFPLCSVAGPTSVKGERHSGPQWRILSYAAHCEHFEFLSVKGKTVKNLVEHCCQNSCSVSLFFVDSNSVRKGDLQKKKTTF